MQFERLNKSRGGLKMAGREKKWRVTLADTDLAEWQGGWAFAIGRARAEVKIPDTLAFHRLTRPGLFIQRYQDILVDANYKACKKYNVRVARGPTTGGGAIYGEPGTGPLLIMIWDTTKHPEIPTDPNLVFPRAIGALADIVSERWKVPLRYRPLNDTELWDPRMGAWRKVGPCGITPITGNITLFAWGPQLTRPSKIAAEVLVSPADKFADKVLKEVTLRNWNFEEAGAFSDRPTLDLEELYQEWMEITKEALKRAFGIEAEEEIGKPTDIEHKYCEEFIKMFSSEDHIFARSAEHKFKEIPEGTNLGKTAIKVTGGPLIRTYVLREGNVIRDIMLCGTVHMFPADFFETVENNLRGMKIDDALIESRVKEVAEREKAVIGLMDNPGEQLADQIIKACKLAGEFSKNQL
jgi:hypothetical protein